MNYLKDKYLTFRKTVRNLDYSQDQFFNKIRECTIFDEITD